MASQGKLGNGLRQVQLTVGLAKLYSPASDFCSNVNLKLLDLVTTIDPKLTRAFHTCERLYNIQILIK